MKLRDRFIALAFVTLTLAMFQTRVLGKEVARFPFENRNGSIVLTVKLNNFPRPLKLLFDTGASGIAVGQSLADSIGLKNNSSKKASLVGGTMDISISEGNTVHLGAFRMVNQNIAIFKELHKVGTDGVIGNMLLKHYIFKVDYDRKEILLYNFGDFEEKEASIIPITTPQGMIMIPGTLNISGRQPHQGNFAFDTGASYNLICFRPFVRKNKLLVSGFKVESSGGTISMGMRSPTFTGNAASFSISGLPPVKNMSVTLMAGTGENETWNPGADGSLGIGFISKYNFTINMQKKEIYVVPNQINKNGKV